MRDARAELGSIAAQVEKRGCVVLVDFDGTLAPIVRHHRAARMSAATRSLLGAVSKRFPTAVVSGRALDDVRMRVRLPISYAGAHGLEMHVHGGDRIPTVRMPAATARAFEGARAALLSAARGYRRIRIEDKGVSLAIHYRSLRGDAVRAFRRDARIAIAPFVRKRMVRAIDDLGTFDIMPDLKRTKGHAVRELVRALRASPRALAVYIGDGMTDEDAFRALRAPHFTIRVGKSATSAARLFVARRADVDTILRKLSRIPAL